MTGLVWEKTRFMNSWTWTAYCGSIVAGSIVINIHGRYAYRVQGIDVKWLTRRNNQVSRLTTAKKAVERAWSIWRAEAGL